MDRRQLLEAIKRLKQPVAPSTLQAWKSLKVCLDDPVSDSFQTEWFEEVINAYKNSRESMEETELRREAIYLGEDIRLLSVGLLEKTRKALVNGDFAYFENIGAMIRKLLDPERAQKREENKEHELHFIGLIIASEVRARDKLNGRITNGFNGPMPHQGNLTAVELRDLMELFLGRQLHDVKTVRRWCDMMGYQTKAAKTGRPLSKKLPPN